MIEHEMAFAFTVCVKSLRSFLTVDQMVRSPGEWSAQTMVEFMRTMISAMRMHVTPPVSF